MCFMGVLIAVIRSIAYSRCIQPFGGQLRVNSRELGEASLRTATLELLASKLKWSGSMRWSFSPSDCRIRIQLWLHLLHMVFNSISFLRTDGEIRPRPTAKFDFMSISEARTDVQHSTKGIPFLLLGRCFSFLSVMSSVQQRGRRRGRNYPCAAYLAPFVAGHTSFPPSSRAGGTQSHALSMETRKSRVCASVLARDDSLTPPSTHTPTRCPSRRNICTAGTCRSCRG